MRQLLVLVVLMIASPASGNQDMQLKIVDKGDNLLVYLLNSSPSSMRVNKRFAEGGSIGPTELVLIFTDKEKKEYKYLPMQKIGLASNEDYVVLKPGTFVGRVFDFKDLKAEYGLDAGEYRLRAIFEDPAKLYRDCFSKHLESEYVSVTIS